jgi:repressor LexA
VTSTPLQPDALSRALEGREVRQVLASGQQLSILFRDGATLLICPVDNELIVKIDYPEVASGQPTKRQSEYLVFIEKYIRRFYGAPAESDIQRHFLVSAPTVNQMMQTLERRGFITRQPGVARSIRLCKPFTDPREDPPGGEE